MLAKAIDDSYLYIQLDIEIRRPTLAGQGAVYAGRGSLGFDYAYPLGGGNRLLLHADTAIRSGYNGDPSLSRFTDIDGYSVTNARIGVSFDSRLELHLFARNLFAADYIQNVTIQAGNSGLILAQPSEPRVIGGTVGFRF